MDLLDQIDSPNYNHRYAAHRWIEATQIGNTDNPMPAIEANLVRGDSTALERALKQTKPQEQQLWLHIEDPVDWEQIKASPHEKACGNFIEQLGVRSAIKSSLSTSDHQGPF